jgi:hypothetical protein
MTYVDASPVIEEVAWTLLGHFFENWILIERIAFEPASATDASRNYMTLNHWVVGSIPTRCKGLT